MTILQPPHDKFFRSSMAIPAVAKDFLQAHLPVRIREVMDITTLKLEKESFVEEDLKNSIGDVLFSIKTGDRDAYIYLLIEHQSKPDPWMAFRLFKYKLNICDRYLKTHPKSKKLPLIYPMVFYNGKRKYNAEKNLWNLFEDSVLAKEFWAEDHKVINVHDIPDEEMKERPWSGFMELSMKHIRSPDLLEKWREMANFLPRIRVEIGSDYIRMIACYALTTIPKDDKMEFIKLVNDNLTAEEGEEIMSSVAQEWWDGGRQEGRQEGMRKGIQEEKHKIALSLIEKGIGLADISDVTGLSMKELMLLCQKRQR